MFNLEELRQFVAFAENGTLAKVAESFMISTPSLSRSMRHVEETFGVPIFNRSANSISLNETGERAVIAAKEILNAHDNALKDVKQFHLNLETISIVSVAPMPLNLVLSQLRSTAPNKRITHHLMDIEEVISSINNKEVSLAILPFQYERDEYEVKELIKEQLFIAVTPDHELAKKGSVSLEDINGYNFLLRSNIGFWDRITQSRMPKSKFLVQSNQFDFDELVQTSTLPRFVTNLSQDLDNIKTDRVIIPISDNEATVTFYLVVLDEKVNFI